jgi:predicted MFS family arabinose efflux permease
LLLLVLSFCGFAGALATRLLDPLITSIAASFSVSVGVVALLSSAFALPFGLSQPLLGPLGDAFGKARLIRIATILLAICLLAAALSPNLITLFVMRILGGAAAGGIMPACMALIGDAFPLAVRHLAMSRYLSATLVGQLVGVSVGGIIAEWISWRGVLACAGLLAAIAGGAALLALPKESAERPARFRPRDAGVRYRLVLSNPRSFVCFGIVFMEGLAIYGVTPFIGELLQMRHAGGVREAGFVIGGLGIGGLSYSLVVPIILKFVKRPTMMAVGGAVAAAGLTGLAVDASWVLSTVFMVILGFGFFLLHNSVQTEVTELAPAARASSFSLHAFSFFLGQALGPLAYGFALSNIGVTISLYGGAAILAVTGVLASVLLARPPLQRG